MGGRGRVVQISLSLQSASGREMEDDMPLRATQFRTSVSAAELEPAATARPTPKTDIPSAS